jgi:phospholipase/lecithinase/hemolysin
VSSIGAGVERLVDYGARRIIVANVPDLALLPGVRRAAAGGDEWVHLAAAAAITQAFNEQLEARLARIEAERGIVLVRFDLAGFLRAETESAQLGRNATDGCFDSETYWLWKAERVFHAGCAPLGPGAAPRFADFVFWDAIHPTGASHAALGAALLAAYTAAFAG